ncbi:MAG TPA: sugar transferase [Thermotogaceae bacterium]|nr:sugar transferase [Thermotogaceae bacterium]
MLDSKKIQRFLKRFFDIFFSVIGIIILFPVMLVIAAAIKLDSKGPVIYKQDRLGKNGRIFKIYKFRTMIENAEKMGSGLFTFENDPRITKVGKFLRKTSLDELPQLFNVLKGDMSFVGPRPPVPFYPKKWEEYTVYEKKRFSVRPGITGWAQVNGRNEIDWSERIKLDVWYVDNWSLILDLKIILKSIKVVLKKEGVYKN